MRWVPTVSLCFSFGITALIAACSFSEVGTACDGGDDLADAVFRFQFANNLSAAGERAGAYFLAVEDDRDPSSALLSRFSDHSPPVRPLSDLTLSESEERVIDPTTGKPGLIFRIYRRSLLSNSEAIVEGGYYEANLSASWITMRAECREGTWRVERIGPQKIASLAE